MTGWSAVTVVPKDREYEYVNDTYQYLFDDGEFFMLPDVIRKWALEYGTDGGIYTNTARVGGPYGSVAFARFGGYREWEEDEWFLETIIEELSHAVVIHANDTSDTGVARLYQNVDGDIVKTDEYEEDEIRDGRPVGKKAASYMMFHHDVPALSNDITWMMMSEEDNGERI